MRLPRLLNANHISPFFDLDTQSFSTAFPSWLSDQEKLSISFDMPGMKKDDIKIESKNGYLLVSGKRETKSIQGTSTRTYSFQTVLPEGLQEDAIEATYNDGVLTLSADQKSISPEVKKITIK